jgi:mercuric ion binding protein
MPENVGADQLAIIRIEGMHCHKCEQSIQKSLLQHPGVNEVEVDFNSGQASVLYDHHKVDVKTLTEAVSEAGYRVTGFSLRDFIDPTPDVPSDRA